MSGNLVSSLRARRHLGLFGSMRSSACQRSVPERRRRFRTNAGVFEGIAVFVAILIFGLESASWWYRTSLSTSHVPAMRGQHMNLYELLRGHIAVFLRCLAGKRYLISPFALT